MERIRDILKEKRPNLSEGSLKTYLSLLKRVYDLTFDDEDYKVEKFNKVDKILKKIQDLPLTTRKTITASLYVLTEKPEYKTSMTKDITAINKETAKQELNNKQRDSWISLENVNSVFKIYKTLADATYKRLGKKDSFTTPEDLQNIQNYIIIALLGGLYIPPRRLQDYTDFKIKNIDTDEDNYMTKNKFVFNSYKTAKTYGTQEVPIPEELKKIIKKWITVNPTEYLLFDIHNRPLSNVTLNQRLNKIFEGKISVNQLRHTFLTDHYGHGLQHVTDLQHDMRLMGSSLLQQQTYIKKHI